MANGAIGTGRVGVVKRDLFEVLGIGVTHRAFARKVLGRRRVTGGAVGHIRRFMRKGYLAKGCCVLVTD